VLAAFLRFLDQYTHMGVNDWYLTSWEASEGGVAGLVMFVLLVAYTIWDTMRAKVE
jgi:hypothetical protein